MLGLVESDNPTECYMILDDGITSESVGGRFDRILCWIRPFPIVRSGVCRKAFSTIAETTAHKICHVCPTESDAMPSLEIV